MCKVLLQIISEPGVFSLVPQATGLLFGSSLKDGAYYQLLLRIRSAHLEILGFPMGGAY